MSVHGKPKDTLRLGQLKTHPGDVLRTLAGGPTTMVPTSDRRKKPLSAKAGVLSLVAGLGLALAAAGAQAGTISGTIAFAEGGAAPSNVSVTVRLSGSGATVGSDSAYAVEGWVYSVGNLSAGDYKVEFKPSGGTYLTEWWQDQTSSATATIVTLGAGGSATVSPTLDPGGTVSGTIDFAPGGTEPAWARVNMVRVDISSAVDSTDSDASRNWGYSFTGLQAGTYKLEFVPQGGTYLAEWWQDASSRESATEVSVNVGTTTTVDPAMIPAATISGTLGFSAGTLEPASASVVAYQAGSGAVAGLAYTDASRGWNYELGGLPAGDFKVEFRPEGGTCVPEWWQDGADQATAAVVVTAAGTATTVSPTLNLPPASILWREASSGHLYVWHMDGATQTGGEPLSPNQVPTNWEIAGTGDFNEDGNPDILWRETAAGLLYVWYMDGAAQTGGASLSPGQVSTNWRVAAVRDFNGDGKPDLLWRESTAGLLYVWYLDGVAQSGGAFVSPMLVPVSWALAGSGDFNGDGKPDLLWRETTDGYLYVWYMDGVTQTGGTFLSPMQVATNWQVAAVGDFTGDGKPDLLWRESAAGDLYLWHLDGVTQTGGGFLSPDQVSTNWGIAAYDTFSSVSPAPLGTCESCHDGSVAKAPNVMQYWTGSVSGQDGGHGDAGGAAAVACTDCHDLALPEDPVSARHATGTYNSIWTNDGTRSANTSHLKAGFFTEFPANAPGDWSVQVAMDNYCTWKCHDVDRDGVWDAAEPTAWMRHSRDLPSGAGNEWSVQFGTHLTKGAGDADDLLGIPIDLDLNTAAGGYFAPCISCHDPHGTGIVKPGGYSSNFMMRQAFPPASNALCGDCHL